MYITLKVLQKCCKSVTPMIQYMCKGKVLYMKITFKNRITKGICEVNAINDEMALVMIDHMLNDGYQVILTDEVEELLLKHGKIKKY